jgi:SsrA-binding protein
MTVIAKNARATFDYDILSRFEAGIVLSGQEVKSAKAGHMSLKGAFVTLHDQELYLTNALISPYKYAGPLPDYDPTHARKLLVHRNEIKNLIGKMRTENLTIVPLRVYTKGRYVKVECAVARGKKAHDKRQTIKKRDADRTIRRALRHH